MSGGVRFNYKYQDADNYKRGGSVVFSNPGHMPLDEVDARLRATFDLGEYFIADQLDVEEAFLFSDEPDGFTTFEPDGSDDAWHTFDDVEACEAESDDTGCRTIREFA